MERKAKIYVAGHTGMVGSAICRALVKEGYSNIITRSHSELDLCDQASVNSFFETEKPEYVFLAAAKVGGIVANNTFPADFLMTNLKINTNVIDACYKNKVSRLLYLGSNCTYPRDCPQPVKEEYLLTNPFELTNEAFAVAKIAGLKACYYLNRQYGTKYIAAMPCNLYGPNDDFGIETSHVLSALINKFYMAKVNNEKTVTIWGSGTPLREFLYVDDMANACIFLMNRYFEDEHINIGYGSDISIRDLAEKISSVVGFNGEIVLDLNRPDGTPRKLLESSKLFSMGWKPTVSLDDGIKETYKWYKNVLLKTE